MQRLQSLQQQERGCCLAWSLTRATQARIAPNDLKALHEEVRSCAELMGVDTIEVGATHGLLICRKAAKGLVTTVDTMVRLGQLLCRWAASDDRQVGLRVGVHKGDVQWIDLASANMRGYFGSAVSMAKHLSDIAPRDAVVHILPSTKQALRMLEKMRFNVSVHAPTGAHFATSYFLEPWVEASVEENDDAQATVIRATTTAPLLPQEGTLWSKVATMSVPEFTAFLNKHSIDTDQFGRGAAKSLAEFYKEIVLDKRSYLLEKSGKLERRLELVRLDLVARDSHGKDHCLMLASETNESGKVRTRNQKLAVVVPEGVSWQEAVKSKFFNIFELPEDLQSQAFSVEANDFKEETSQSLSVPGLPSTYLTHEIRMRVLDPSMVGLQKIGLPNFDTFSTKQSGNETNNDSQTQSQQWQWAGVGGTSANNTDSLFKLLCDHNINVAEFDHGALNDLVEEVYQAKVSTLMLRGKELQRHLQIVKVWVRADILSVPHLLVQTAKWYRGKRDTAVKDRPISMRLNHGQSWQQALSQALQHRLNLDQKKISEWVEVDEASYSLCEEVEYSRSYPGLKTVYRIHEITCRMSTHATSLGLPDGQEFGVPRRLSPSIDDIAMTCYTWKAQKDIFDRQCRYEKSLLDKFPASDPKDVDAKRRVPAPNPLPSPPKSLLSSGLVVQEVMKGKKTNWDRARNAAKRIRDQDYTCKMFFEDCVAAFPELALYMGIAGPDGKAPATSSGRSADDEYQRTIGALFAVYWLMRLNIDGAQSFCFGVGSDGGWPALSTISKTPKRSAEEKSRRGGFLNGVKWSLFEEVLISSGMLISGTDGVKGHDEERTLAMLVLTAIHDIMKIEQLLPSVSGSKTREFSGYRAGETITDHDVALGYVLEYAPDALPSYAGLPAAQRDSVKFTQCNMEYNMGWLVQAEAPPGALFRKFKSIITAGKADPKDVAFYFTHWLTDLAGAEPYPTEGCEKFVLKFPQKVLSSFLLSFPFVQHLSTKSETQVYEDYLGWRWRMNDPPMGMPPAGEGAVAKMRLTVMAQGHSSEYLEAYEEMEPEVRQVLDAELAQTGLQGQAYDGDAVEMTGGPAFLVYYGPALLQKNHADAQGALFILAEVLRQARSLWPLAAGKADETVTVMVDALKELTIEGMLQLNPGEIWALHRITSKSAQVKKMSMLKDKEQLDWSSMRLLTFSSAPNSGGAATTTHQTSILQGEKPIYGLLPVDDNSTSVNEVSALGKCSGCFGLSFCL
mmetsp:Transcript_93313/g.194722  ORF Transcript_93313/g.194722 Transcript_93313/m.194722 type:complete len:1242 (+) Transcript_93313:93-3818(+)